MTHTPRSPCPYPLGGPHLVPGRARVRRAQGGGGRLSGRWGALCSCCYASMREDTGLDEATQRRTAVDTAEMFAFRRRAAGRGGCSPSKCARAVSPSCATQPCGRTPDRGGGKRGRTDCDQPPPNTPLAGKRAQPVGWWFSRSVGVRTGRMRAWAGRLSARARARAPPPTSLPPNKESFCVGVRVPLPRAFPGSPPFPTRRSRCFFRAWPLLESVCLHRATGQRALGLERVPATERAAHRASPPSPLCA